MPSLRSSGSSSASASRVHREYSVCSAVAAALEGPADQFLICERAVDLGGVEVGDAQIQRPMDRADRFCVAACPDVVVTGHRHGAESNAGNVESADRDVLHGVSVL